MRGDTRQFDDCWSALFVSRRAVAYSDGGELFSAVHVQRTTVRAVRSDGRGHQRALWQVRLHLAGPSLGILPTAHWCASFSLTYLLTYLLTTSLLITDHFGGPGRSVGPVCVCLSYVWTKTFERFDLWPGYLECWFILTCPVRAPGRRCALVHLLISVLYRLFVCSLNFLTSFLSIYFLTCRRL